MSSAADSISGQVLAADAANTTFKAAMKAALDKCKSVLGTPEPSSSASPEATAAPEPTN